MMANSLLRILTPVFSLRFRALPSTLCKNNILKVHKIIEVRFSSRFVDQSFNRHASGLNQEPAEKQIETKLLKVAIIGVPNAGKSTIINQLVSRRVCSISSKVHTTRCKARAIAVHGDTQLVFLDTPGLVNASESDRHNLEHAFHTDSELAMLEADVIGVIHDISNTWTRSSLDPKVLRLLHLYPMKHSFLMLNKIDVLKSKRQLLDVVRILTNGSLKNESDIHQDHRNKNSSKRSRKSISAMEEEEEEEEEEEKDDSEVCHRLTERQVQDKLKKERGWSNFREVFIISALTGDGTDDVRDYLLHMAEPSPWIYPADQFTDQPSETVVLNTVRSKLLDHLPKEIPYNLTTAMEYFEYTREGTISTVVLIGCPSPRLEKLLLGSRGMRIREIARDAEQELQSTFRQPVRLKVVVTSKSKAVNTVIPNRQLA